MYQKKFHGSIGAQDIDLCGPSVPKMLNVEDREVSQCEDGWIPVSVGDTLSVMSIGFLMTNKNEAVVWRGPKKNAMIKQFLTGKTHSGISVGNSIRQSKMPFQMWHGEIWTP